MFVYRGNLKDSKIHGYGEFKWPDGRHYIGDFVNSQMQGQGKMTWLLKNGKKNVYKGRFLANVFHGAGSLLIHNGDTYEGQFENGKFSGEGSYKWAAKPRLSYRGEFKNGLLHGTGTLENMNGVFQG